MSAATTTATAAPELLRSESWVDSFDTMHASATATMADDWTRPLYERDAELQRFARKAARAALLHALAAREARSGETVAAARRRMSAYLAEVPPVIGAPRRVGEYAHGGAIYTATASEGVRA